MGLRLKLAVSVLVSSIIIVLGIVLYGYQKDIIFDQAKQNSYAAIDDLIRFTQNEIDASRDKVEHYGQSALSYLQGWGDYRTDTAELITFWGWDARVNKQVPVDVPAIYWGDTRLQGNTEIYDACKNMGIEFLLYYQLVDEYMVEILNSHNREPLNVNATFAYPLDHAGLWHLNAYNEPAFTLSYWEGSKWVQTIRLFVKDEKGHIAGVLVVGIQERNEIKLSRTFLDKHFYETGICYQLTGNGEVTFHPNLPNFYQPQDSAFKMIAAHTNSEVADFTSFTDSTGIDKYLFYKYYPANYSNVVVEIPKKEMYRSLYALRSGIIIAIIVMVFFIYLTITYIANTLTRRLEKAVDVLERLAIGDTLSDDKLDFRRQDEIGHIAHAVIDLKQNLTQIGQFAAAIGEGKLDTEFEPLSEVDQLGNALINMQESLQQAKKDEELNRVEEEKNRWTSNGLAQFSDIVRVSDLDIQQLAYNILKNLVNYLDLSMGAIYIAEEDTEGVVFVPQAALAYERQKILDTKIQMGEGLVGRSAFEKMSIYMTDIPENYITIRSGLGDANPNNLFIVPLMAEEEVLGVIELASFDLLADYKRAFVEKLADSIGATLHSAKVNQQTVQLLEQSKVQSEELAAQEEEMRQNLEELQSTQEEAHRREAEMLAMLDAMNHSVFQVEYNLQGTITNINEKYTKFLEISPETLLHKKLSDELTLLNLDPALADKILRTCAAGDAYKSTVPVLYKEENYTIETHYTPVRSATDDQVQRIIKISYVVAS